MAFGGKETAHALVTKRAKVIGLWEDAPLSDTELLEKMTWLLEGIAPAHIPRRLLELCSRLSTVDDAKELIGACNVT